MATPQTLGKYQLLQEIGRGGMGAVYKAYDPFLDRTVAIKLLAPHLVWEKDFVERFLREARAAARLRHPNIIEIHDVGQEGSNYYFVMAYMPGSSLKELTARQSRLPPAKALPILRQLADALDYIHAKGLVHRDVKPANIMFDERDQAVLMDFGIVKAAQESRLTATGSSIGTPHYMSPEQIQGQPVDARTDQYALGIIAFELLTGRVPFDADTTTAILYKHVNAPPPSATACCPDLPSAIETVLNRALSKSPDERYATCGDLAKALEQALAPSREPQPAAQAVVPPAATKRTTPTIVPQPPPAAPPPTRPGKNPLPFLLAGAGIAAVVLVTLIVIAILNNRGAPTATPTIIAQPAQTSTLMPSKTPAPASTKPPTPITPTRRPANTLAPTATPLPGRVVVPVEKMARSIPWLPMDSNAVPATFYYGFNVNIKPFDNRLVRQAFAASIDRQAIVDALRKQDATIAMWPATSFTPSETLGRDLYGVVGMSFDPAAAQKLLAQAGYPDGQGFPAIKLVTNSGTSGNNATVAHTVAKMWQAHLRINVQVEITDDWDAYQALIATDAPAIYRLGWAADFNDPDDFLNRVFHSQSEGNHGHFSNSEFDRLVEQAAKLSDPAARQALYIQAERILCASEAALIPIYHYTTQ